MLVGYLRDGVASTGAMAQRIAPDKLSDVRQLDAVDAAGHAVGHTGARCNQYAVHHIGDGYGLRALSILV